jgi:hypothetical protein
MPNPMKVDAEHIKLGIHSSVFSSSVFHHLRSPIDWAQHGICGRAVFLDLLRYYNDKPPYEPLQTSSISVAQLQEVAKAQGVTFRHGDILLLRVGFIQAYNKMSDEDQKSLGGKAETL